MPAITLMYRWSDVQEECVCAIIIYCQDVVADKGRTPVRFITWKPSIDSSETAKGRFLERNTMGEITP